MKKYTEILEEVGVKRLIEISSEDKQLDAAMKKALAGLKSISDKDLAKVKNEGTIDISEEDLNEILFTAPFIIGLILGAPALTKLFTKALGGLFRVMKKLFKKSANNERGKIEKTILNFTEKWHDFYIKVVIKILELSGTYKAANITDKASKRKAAEVVFLQSFSGSRCLAVSPR